MNTPFLPLAIGLLAVAPALAQPVDPFVDFRHTQNDELNWKRVHQNPDGFVRIAQELRDPQAASKIRKAAQAEYSRLNKIPITERWHLGHLVREPTWVSGYKRRTGDLVRRLRQSEALILAAAGEEYDLLAAWRPPLDRHTNLHEPLNWARVRFQLPAFISDATRRTPQGVHRLLKSAQKELRRLKKLNEDDGFMYGDSFRGIQIVVRSLRQLEQALLRAEEDAQLSGELARLTASEQTLLQHQATGQVPVEAVLILRRISANARAIVLQLTGDLGNTPSEQLADLHRKTDQLLADGKISPLTANLQHQILANSEAIVNLGNGEQGAADALKILKSD